MIIESSAYKQKIINELKLLMSKKKLIWKSLNENNNDFMTSIKYFQEKETGAVAFFFVGYRVCCFGNTPRIILYDYTNKKGATETTDLPSIEVFDKGTKNSEIYEILEQIKDILEKDRIKKEEDFLDKLTWFLNAKEKKEVKKK